MGVVSYKGEIMFYEIVSNLFADDAGQTLVETSLIYLLIAIAAFLSLKFFGGVLFENYSNSVSKIADTVK